MLDINKIGEKVSEILPKSPQGLKSSEKPQAKPFGLSFQFDQSILIFGLILFIFGLVVTWGILGIKKAQIKTIEKELATLEQQLAPQIDFEKKILAFQEGVKGLQSAWDSQIYWSKFFDELKKVITKDTKLTNLSISKEGLGKIDGESKDYPALASFIQNISNAKAFSSVSLSSLSTEKGVVSFSISFKVLPASFKKTGGVK